MAGASRVGKLSQSGYRDWWSARYDSNAGRSSHAGHAGSLPTMAFLECFSAAGCLVDNLGNTEENRIVNALR